MAKPCKQISIPNTDNTSIPCNGEYINSNCVEILNLPSEVRVYFELDETPTLSEVLTAYGLSLIDVRSRVNNLENPAP